MSGFGGWTPKRKGSRLQFCCRRTNLVERKLLKELEGRASVCTNSRLNKPSWELGVALSTGIKDKFTGKTNMLFL